MAIPEFNSVGARLYDALGPLAYQDAELGYPLGHYCNAIGSMLADVDELVRETDTHTGWAKAMDVDVAPISVLPWLAQFVGVVLEPQGDQDRFEWSDRQRDRIRTHNAYERGTVLALVRGAQEWLTGTKTVYLRERDTTAWHMTIVTLVSETPDPAGMLSNLRTEHKAAGLTLAHNMVTGWDYIGIDSAYATYTAIDTDFSRYDRIQEGPA
jgi:hypothetical protein